MFQTNDVVRSIVENKPLLVVAVLDGKKYRCKYLGREQYKIFDESELKKEEIIGPMRPYL